MVDHQEGADKYEDAFKSDTNLQEFPDVFDDFAPLSHNLDHSQKSCQLDKFVHSANSSDPYKITIFISSFYNNVKRKNGDKVDREPAFKVFFGNKFSICYGNEIFVIEAGIEDDDDVYDKEYINNNLRSFPS